MTEYVAGFYFDQTYDYVLLMRKNRPDWQSGRINGIGGHIEPGESPWNAMKREFREEAGLTVDHWDRFAIVSGEWGNVHFFRASGNPWNARSMTDELVDVWPMRALPLDELIPNLKFLLPLAAHQKDVYRIVQFEEISKGRPF